MSDSESISDIEDLYSDESSESTEDTLSEPDISDADEYPEEATFDSMMLYLDSIARNQINPYNKIRREIEKIKSGISTQKKLSDSKKIIKEKFTKMKKDLNKKEYGYAVKILDINTEIENKINELTIIYKENKNRLDELYKMQKNRNVLDVKINCREFFKNCPDNLKEGVFIVLVQSFTKTLKGIKNHDIEEIINKEEYLLDRINKNHDLEEIINEEYLLDRINKDLFADDIKKHGQDLNIFEEFDVIICKTDRDLTMRDIFDAMQKNATGKDYMKFVMFVNTFEFNRFIAFTKARIEEDGKIIDIENIIDYLPNFLSTTTKENKLRRMFKEADNFGMDHIVKFLAHDQTSGLYYQALMFLADYYHVEHKNCVPIFDDLLITGGFKEEALGIYVTLRAYQTDEFIVNNYNYMNYILQEPQQISWLPHKKCKKIDMTIPGIRTNHEFNERHHNGKAYKLNDQRKKSYAKICGRHTIYFQFNARVYDHKKGKTIIDKSYLCEEYMEKYVDECRQNAINGILLNIDARDKFIIKLLKESLILQVESIDKTLDKYKDSTELSKDEYDGKIATRNLKQSVLTRIDYSQIVFDMFACKSLGTISFSILLKIFGFTDVKKNKDVIGKLKKCLSCLNIIENSMIDEKDIKISWKQLLETIIKFDNGNKELSKVLYEYWLELNESYENIILRIQTFYENIVCNKLDKENIEDLIKEQFIKNT